jgi:hypothetical protein
VEDLCGVGRIRPRGLTNHSDGMKRGVNAMARRSERALSVVPEKKSDSRQKEISGPFYIYIYICICIYIYKICRSVRPDQHLQPQSRCRIFLGKPL